MGPMGIHTKILTTPCKPCVHPTGPPSYSARTAILLACKVAVGLGNTAVSSKLEIRGRLLMVDSRLTTNTGQFPKIRGYLILGPLIMRILLFRVLC